MKNGLINGLLAGIIFSVLYLTVNFIAPKLNFSFIYTSLSFLVIFLFFMIRASNQEETIKKEIYVFGDALIPAMTCYAVASFVYLIFTFMIFKFDPMQVEYAQEARLESIDFWGNLLGNKNGALVEQMEQDQDEVIKQFTSFGTNFINWFVSLIFPGLIIGAIAAKLARKKTTTI